MSVARVSLSADGFAFPKLAHRARDR
eukprot:COSAG01_NODE_77058_length_171_cov_1982.513889_1_plen_25_part_10